MERRRYAAILLAIVIVGALYLGGAFERAEVAPLASGSPHAFQSNVKVEIEPTTHWQPRGGEIRIDLQSLGDGLKLHDASIFVRFRWSTKSGTGAWIEAPSVRVVDAPNAQTLVVAARVPAMPDAPSYPIAALLSTKEDGVRNFLGLVPVAEVWIQGQPAKAGDPGFVDEVRTMGITLSWVAGIGAIGTVALLIAFVIAFKPSGLHGSNIFLKLIETVGARASLSQFQIMLWTLIIGAAIAYVMILSGNLVPLTQGTLILLGISGIAVLGAQLPTPPGGQKPDPAGGGVVAPVAGAVPAPPVPSAAAAAGEPSWRDLISSDGEIDVTRVQMLFFTVLMAVFVAIHVIDNYQIPEILETFLGLMGISNGVYLLSKFVPGKNA
jgi:hypothetical protein